MPNAISEEESLRELLERLSVTNPPLLSPEQAQATQDALGPMPDGSAAQGARYPTAAKIVQHVGQIDTPVGELGDLLSGLDTYANNLAMGQKNTKGELVRAGVDLGPIKVARMGQQKLLAELLRRRMKKGELPPSMMEGVEPDPASLLDGFKEAGTR